MAGRQSKLAQQGTPLTEFESRLSKEEAAKQAQSWMVLRNRTRLRVIDLLSRYDGLLCVMEIAEVLEEAPSVISNHMAMLKAAGLVEAERHQVYTYYRLKPNALDGFRNHLESFVGE